MDLELPDPDGRDSYGPGAWWLLTSGQHVFAQPGCVYGLMNNDRHRAGRAGVPGRRALGARGLTDPRGRPSRVNGRSTQRRD
jgi:hypothetical protein